MPLFKKKQERKRIYQNKLKKKKNEVRLPRVFEKFLLMIQLFGSTDVARTIIEMVQQMNREDTIEFRGLNNAMILSNYSKEWSMIMKSISWTYNDPYISNIFNNNNIFINTYDFIYNNNYIESKSDYLLYNTYYIANNPKNTRKKDIKHTLTKHEHNLRKSFHKHENKRRNKMIKYY